MGRHSLICFFSIILCALSSAAFAQEDESAWSFTLDSVTVKGYRYTLPVKTEVGGLTKWNVSELSLMPQVFGNAEPMRYAQMLPGVQTNSENRSGINIEGCDSQHNLISVEGVPIYNINHLLGFFSTFNTSHFSSLSIAKGVIGAGSPNCIGGQLDMHHFTDVPDTTNGMMSLGLISSQGTIRTPIGRKTTITASLRGSYINLLYSRWLRIDDQQINYSFYDANLTINHQINNHNKLLFDFYRGNDVGSFTEQNYLADMKARWGNAFGAAHWLYDNGNELQIKTTAYATNYQNIFSLEIQDILYRLPSGITDFGLKNNLKWEGLDVGVEAVCHSIRPQSLEQENGFNAADKKAESEHSIELSAYANYERNLIENLKISGGVRGGLFIQNGIKYTALDPSVRFLYDNSKCQVSATYALRHQYLFQTGFSDCGLPTEFWISAGKGIKPQYAHEITIGGSSFLLNDRYKLAAGLFYRRLYHQLAYRGSVLDFVNTAYDINRLLMHGRGENYGFNLMLNKCAGRLTGWISYTYTRAHRSFDTENLQKSYPASHERPHELNAVLSCAIGKHWNIGGTMVYASGTPLTPIESLYILNNNIMVKYGEYNSDRLRPYMRIDLSANYKWTGKRNSEQGVNFSLYNASCRKNELFRFVRTRQEGAFYYKSATFILYALPSVSYYYKF